MGKRLLFWETAGFLFVAAAGTLLHFVYDWSGGSALAAVFSAVNESTWEHMKLLFVPMVAVSAAQQAAFGREISNLTAVRAVSTLTGLALIPILFYTYMGVLGFGVTWANISVFYLSALAAFALDFRLLRRGRFSALRQQRFGAVILLALGAAFIWCTFHPPELGLWRDPVTGGFGI